MDGIMQDDKKTKKDMIDKLRMILDNPHINDESIKNKDLLRLQKKLVEPSALHIISSRKTVEETDNDDPLKPSVTIHREQKISASDDTFIEEKDVDEKEKVVFEEVEEDLFKDEELFEIEKVDDDIEEFTEIKDEEEIFEEVQQDDIIEDSEDTESVDDLPEWETVESEVVESDVKDEDMDYKSIPEWEPITNEQFKDKIPKFKEKKIKKVEFEEKSELESDKVDYDYFNDIKSIDDNIAELLIDNGYKSVDDLKDITIKELTRIKGIKRKTAKKIKRDIKNYYENIKPEFESIDDELSDEEFEQTDFSDEKVDDSSLIHRKDGVFIFGDYTLYRKEITLQSDKKRVIHFFSKEKPDDGEKVDLPDGYEVKVNKKTGVPYISKKN